MGPLAAVENGLDVKIAHDQIQEDLGQHLRIADHLHPILLPLGEHPRQRAVGTGGGTFVEELRKIPVFDAPRDHDTHQCDHFRVEEVRPQFLRQPMQNRSG